MTTGYEAKMYGDISRAAKALERIANALEVIAGKFEEAEPTQAAARSGGAPRAAARE